MTHQKDDGSGARACKGLTVQPVMTRHASCLLVLAGRVTFLSPCHRDPWRFHEEKSEIIEELRRLASEI
jgi:hypothetical protein